PGWSGLVRPDRCHHSVSCPSTRQSAQLFAHVLVPRPSARLASVIGDQATHLRVMIRTGEFLIEIAQTLGCELLGIDLLRTRLSTATKEQPRDEVVVLRWPGCGGRQM